MKDNDYYKCNQKESTMNYKLFLTILLISITACLRGQHLSKKEYTQDVDFIIQSIEDMHPKPYKFFDKEDVIQEKNEWIETIQHTDSLTMKQFLSQARTFTQKYQDSHLWIASQKTKNNKKLKQPSKAKQFNTLKYKVIEDSIAYLKILSLYESKGHRAYLKSEYKEAFQLFNKRKYNTLILDLQHNNGGSQNCIKDLMNHLTNKRYRMIQSYHIKQSKQTRAIKKKNMGKTLYWKLARLTKAGRAWVNGKPGKVYHFKKYKKERVKHVENRFQGKVYAISNNSASAATILIASLKANQIATIIGTQTKDKSFFCGNAHSTVLPNSKFRLYVPVECQTLPNSPKETDKPIQPDIQLNTNKDFLEQTLEVIRKDSQERKKSF